MSSEIKISRSARKIPKSVLQQIDAVNQALSEGFLPVGVAGSRIQMTAVRIAADRLDIDRRTMQGRMGKPGKPGNYFKLYGLQPDWSKFQARNLDAPSAPLAAEDSVAARKIVSLTDEVHRLRNMLRESHRSQLNDDAMRELLGLVRAAPASPPPWLLEPSARKGGVTPEVPVVIWSDWHLGEVVNAEEVNGINSFNMQVAERRIELLVGKTIDLCRQHHTGNYPGIVVNMLGDFVSGGLHPELLKTDEEEIIPTTLRARDLLVAALGNIADAFGKVYVPCAAGNHGRETPKPEFKRYVYKNFDWLIYQLLIRHFVDDPRIVFDVRPTNDVHYRVFNERYLALHGDMLGVKGGDGIIGAIGPIMRGEVKKSRQSSVIGYDYDVLLMGHWHQALNLPRAIVSNTLKGWDEYARLQLGAPPTTPSQPLWFVHPSYGRTSYWEIYLENSRPTSSEWVSVMKDAA